MKPILRSSISAVICIAALSACAPAKRTFNGKTSPAGTSANVAPVDANQGTPTQGDVIRAEANLPLNAGDAGTINLVDSKGASHVINVDPSMNATSTDALVTTVGSFACKQSVTTLSQCADASLQVTVNKTVKLTVTVIRRSGMTVSSQITVPPATAAAETYNFGTASYVFTAVSDGATVRKYDTAMIMGTGVSDSDQMTYDTFFNSEDKTQQVRILVKGAMKNKAGATLNCLSCTGTDLKANLYDQNHNIVKSFNVNVPSTSATPTAEVMTLTVAKMASDGSLNGSTDLSTFKVIPAAKPSSANASNNANPSTVNTNVPVQATIPGMQQQATPSKTAAQVGNNGQPLAPASDDSLSELDVTAQKVPVAPQQDELSEIQTTAQKVAVPSTSAVSSSSDQLPEITVIGHKNQ